MSDNASQETGAKKKAGLFDIRFVIGGLLTLYGAILANLIFAPIAARLKRQARHEAMERLRLEAPLVALAERERPRAAELVHAA